MEINKFIFNYKRKNTKKYSSRKPYCWG